MLISDVASILQPGVVRGGGKLIYRDRYIRNGGLMQHVKTDLMVNSFCSLLGGFSIRKFCLAF